MGKKCVFISSLNLCSLRLCPLCFSLCPLSLPFPPATARILSCAPNPSLLQRKPAPPPVPPSQRPPGTPLFCHLSGAQTELNVWMKSEGPWAKRTIHLSYTINQPCRTYKLKNKEKRDKLNHGKNNDMENMACLNFVEIRRPCTLGDLMYPAPETSQQKSIRTWEAHRKGFLGTISQLPRTWLSWMMSLDAPAPESLFVLKFIRLVVKSMQILTLYRVLWLGVPQCI